MSYIPEDDKARKGLPLFAFITGYFPKTIREMCKVSVVNNVRYNPDKSPTDINWNKSKSTDQLGSSLRHMLEMKIDGKVFEAVPADVAEKTGIDKVFVAAENAWRACAHAENVIDKWEQEQAAKVGPITSSYTPTITRG